MFKARTHHDSREGHEDLIAPGRATNPKSEYRNPKRTLNQISQTEGEGNHKGHKDRTERTFCVLCGKKSSSYGVAVLRLWGKIKISNDSVLVWFYDLAMI